MKLSIRTLTWLIISYVLTILTLSAAIINTKAALNRTWVLHIRLDHLLHALLFIPWMVLLHWRWKEKRSVGFFMLALGAGFLLAVISEGAQLVLPYRAFNVMDLVANWVGVVVGALIAGWGARSARL